MIDNMNVNSQFHPYQPMKDTPASERVTRGFDRVREYARAKPAVVLGALAALVIGAALMRRRHHRTA